MSLIFFIQIGILIGFSLIASIQDINSQRVDILWILIPITAKIIFIVFSSSLWYLEMVRGALCGLFYFLVRLIAKKKLGMADVFYGILQGLFLPLQMIPVCLLLEVLCALFGAKVILKTQRIPFIPFMSSSLIITLFISQLF